MPCLDGLKIGLRNLLRKERSSIDFFGWLNRTFDVRRFHHLHLL